MVGVQSSELRFVLEVSYMHIPFQGNILIKKDVKDPCAYWLFYSVPMHLETGWWGWWKFCTLCMCKILWVKQIR